MKWIIKKFIELKNDKVLMSTVFLSYIFIALLSFLHLRNTENIEIQIRLALVLTFQFFVFFLARTGSRLWIMIYSYLMFWFKGITAYAPFILLAIISRNYSKIQKKIVYAIYTIIVAVHSTLNKISPVVITFHAIKCIIFYFIISEISIKNTHAKRTKLELTPDETTILKMLADGQRISEITIFSPNTICKKLKDARERNGIKDNKKLILIFRNSQLQD